MVFPVQSLFSPSLLDSVEQVCSILLFKNRKEGRLKFSENFMHWVPAYQRQLKAGHRDALDITKHDLWTKTCPKPKKRTKKQTKSQAQKHHRAEYIFDHSLF
jgi:hypothetical protein